MNLPNHQNLLRPSPRSLAWAVAASALLAVPFAHVAAAWPGLRLSADSGVSPVTALVLSVALAPLVEEWALRSLLQRGAEGALRRHRWSEGRAAWAAAALATVVFAAAHLDSWSLPAAVRCSAWLLPGAALAATWCWRRRTRDCVLLHAHFNLMLWWAGSGAA